MLIFFPFLCIHVSPFVFQSRCLAVGTSARIRIQHQHVQASACSLFQIFTRATRTCWAFGQVAGYQACHIVSMTELVSLFAVGITPVAVPWASISAGAAQQGRRLWQSQSIHSCNIHCNFVHSLSEARFSLPASRLWIQPQNIHAHFAHFSN